MDEKTIDQIAEQYAELGGIIDYRAFARAIIEAYEVERMFPQVGKGA